MMVNSDGVADELQRRAISLDGTWDFLHVVEDYRARPVQWRKIEVPGPWQAQFPDLRMRGGVGLYRRDFEIPAGWKSDRVFLRFGAVFHIARVWINGSLVGTNIGGFLPFSFDITDVVREGTNEIKVRADSPADDPAVFPDSPFAEIPFGKQSWYGPLSGIWQSVGLEHRPADHVERVRLWPEWPGGRVAGTLFFACPLQSSCTAVVSAADPTGQVAAISTIELSAGVAQCAIEMFVSRVRSWSPQRPNLYSLRVDVLRDGRIMDRLETSFGFRKIEVRSGQFFLNDGPLYLRAALDQDYYPDTICTTPSTAFLEDQFRKAKQLGLNCIRCHIKAPDPRYYEVADRLGLLIWTELPNMGASTERSRVRKEGTLKGIVDRDGNHPSIFCWTIINENWGVDLVHDAEHRAWLQKTYHWLKAYDPGRLVVDNSPLAPSFHVETDIADYHFYAALPDSREDWDDFVNDLATRPSWLFATDGVQTGQEPIICSEFGNWGLPDPDALRDLSGQEPWWFETGHDWADGVMYPHGVQNRFADWSLGRTFGTLKAFAEAAQWQQFRAMKYAIESMRAKPEIAGYVITELTDVHWESNGLLDMRRNTRAFHPVFSEINADTVVIAKWRRLSYWAGETAAFDVLVAHGAGPGLQGARLRVTLEDGPLIDIETPTQFSPSVIAVGEVKIDLPPASENHISRLRLVIEDPNGIEVAKNSVDLAVFAERKPQSVGRALWSPVSEIRRFLSDLQYEVLSEPSSEALWVCTQAQGTESHVRQGGRLVLLPDTSSSLTPFFPHWQNVRVQQRQGTLWRGDWASSFSWLRRGNAFANLPGGPLLDETFDRVLPTHVIAGCNLLDFQARVHAALVVGWIHKPVALTVERGYGKGRVVISTFRLFRDEALADPTATTLLDALLKLAVAEGSAAAREQDEVLADLF